MKSGTPIPIPIFAPLDSPLLVSAAEGSAVPVAPCDVDVGLLFSTVEDSIVPVALCEDDARVTELEFVWDWLLGTKSAGRYLICIPKTAHPICCSTKLVDVIKPEGLLPNGLVTISMFPEMTRAVAGVVNKFVVKHGK